MPLKATELLSTDIAAQQATQLTDGPGDNTFGGFLSADDRSLWYVKNNQQLRRVDLATLEEQVVYIRWMTTGGLRNLGRH